MKTSRFEKLIAMVLACLMLLTSVPVEMLLTANASDVRGIGVVNTVRTDNENVVTPYRIIIKKNNTEISQRFTVTSTNGKTITVYSDGTFELDNGDGVNFSDSQEFIDLINSYGGVTSVEIKIDDQDNSYYVYDHNNSDKDGFLYSDFVWQYTYEENVVDPETGEPVIDPETGEIVTQTITIPVTYDPTKPKLTYNGYEFDNPNYDYTVKNIRSTFMQRYTVDVLWRDRNENSRPDPDFTVTQTKQDDASYSRTISESPYHTNVSSNEDTYTYRVPEKDKDGKKYIYTAAPSDPGSDYRVEALPDGKTIIYYGLTDYTATLMWLDGASGTYNSVFADDDDKTEKQKVAEYVFENFKLISKSLDENEPDSDLDLAGYAAYSGYDETEEAFLVKDKNGRILHKIIYDPATKELRITGIDQIEYIEENQTSVVRSYYLQCVDETGTADIPDTDDFWGITAVNSGLETNETRKAYSGSTIVNTLTGTQDIYTNIRWLDEDKVSERVGNDGSNQGQIVLWRYANNTDTDKLDRTAQVMTLPLVQTEEITQDETTVTVPARDENGNLIFLDRVTFRNLPKYDQQGYPYVYYMKENLPSHLIGAGYVSNIDNSTATPDGGVGYPQGSHGTSDIIKPGGTAVNKLTGVLAYQIDATWIAAARQGGTDVAVRYTILKENDDGTWERAEGKDPATGLDTDAELLVTGFNAENMSKTVSLPTVSAYDENGKAINYKVVQTFVTRNDNHVTGTCEDEFSLGSNGEAYTGTMHLTHNGESVDYYIINIKPKAVEGADNPLYIVFEYTLIGKKTLNLKKQWNAEHTETEVKVKLKYFDFADKKYKDYMENGEVKYFLIHESDKEYNNTEWTKSVQVDAYDEGGHELEYEMVEVEPTEYGRAYSFDRAASLYTVANSKGGDNGVEIDLKKQWQVDGEMEYRTAIKIDVDSDAIGDDYGRKPETPTNIDVNLNETDFWEGEVPTYYDYVYDPDHFKEHTTSGTAATDYETLEQVVNGRTTYTDGSEWLYKMLSTKYTSGNVVNMADEYKIQFGKAPNIYFAGIYNDGNYYYAVEQIPDLDPEHNPNKKRPSEIQFINTRVGVVSYEISFDWQVGNWLGEGKDVEFKIFANGVERFDPITMHVTSGQAKYYITNLPKYDEMGKIIDYTIQEYTIDGHPVRNGVCEWDNNDGTGNETCIVTMTENGYVNGQNHHSDDLVKVKFTNTFSASRNYTVYKRWKDGDISSSERPDVYLRLWKITNANGGTRTYEDYSWSDNNHEVPNSWSYTFSNIPKYDEHGYKYTYYVEEFPVNGYEITYDNSRNNVESLRDDTTCAYNGGIITNTRVGDVIINGEKAWNNIAPIFAKQYYPVADIYLYRKKHNTTYEDVTEGDRLIQSGSYGELLSATKVFNGDTTFHFTEPCAYGVGIGLETDDTAYSNLIFPRFDEDGYEYVYTLRERSINGYVSEIKGETIVNNYVANEKVSVKVTKYWEHMHANSVYPTSTIILHQVVWARVFDDETGDFEKENGEYVYYPIEYASYKMTPNSQNECLFTELPKYAPDGSEFAFYVTEELNNYIRDPVQFNTYSGDNANKINVNGILGPYNDTGHGFKSVITDVSGKTYDKEATVTNKYMPDLDNFNGQIKVNKSWNYHSENYNNTSEFSKIKGYTFTVERCTTKILTEQLLTVDTNLSYDSEGNEGGVLPKVTILSNDTLHLTTPMAAYDADDSIIENPAANSSQISYYKAVYESYIADQQQKILFTVTITDTNGNRDVLLSGLAIYAQDSVKYTYRVSESAGTPFTLSEASQNTAIPQQIPISDIPDEERITYDLTNELRVFNLRLNKTFSKYFVDENGQTKHSPITHEEEEQFFNRAYLNQLKFNLYRSTTSPVDTSDTAVPYMANISGSDLRWDNEQGTYYLTINSLPKYNAEGVRYLYKVVELESTKGDLVEVDNPDEINASSGTTTPPTNCTVTNSFGAKEIDVEKFWVDSDNCDGLRPEAINIVIEETVTENNKPTNININKTLENSEGWRKRVVLPKYYYNGGTRVEGLTFSISELLSGTAAEHEYNIKKNGYSEDYVSGYKLHDEETIDFPHHSDKVAISENNKDLEALYLRNTKQRIKGEITVRKNWLSNLDDASHWNIRPESIYIKLMRRLDEEGASPYVVTSDIDGGVIGTNGVITLSKTDSYGCVIGNLPYGETTGADMQHNGTFTKYIYYVVECDSAGRVYQKIGDSAFGYNWSQTINGEEEKALDLTYSGSGSDQVVNGAKLTSTVSNELQETEHTLTRIWDDEKNYYSTRDRIEVHLWRKLATESDSAFVDLTTQSLPAAVVVSKQFEKAYNESNSTYTDSTTFTHLPKYNENGIEYVYKIKEYSIGTNLVLSMTHIYGNSPDVSSYGTYNYDVKEEEAPSGTVTTITNTLVTRKDNFAIEVAKQWDDNFNQDGKRPSSITYKLTQSYTNDNSETISTDFEQTVTAYGEDGWSYTWSYLPAFTSDGKLYTYTVNENPVAGYTTTALTPTTRTEGINTINIYTFKNSYEPQTDSLSVTKKWNDEQDNFSLRPDGVQLELWCTYEKYVDTEYSNDPANRGDPAHLSDMGEVSLSATDADCRLDTAKQTITETFKVASASTAVITSEGTEWTVTFDGLPVKINPTGGSRYEGHSVAVTYFVKEKILKDTDHDNDPATPNELTYDSEYDAAKRLDYICESRSTSVPLNATANTDNVRIENTLRTRSITVTKDWTTEGGVSFDTLSYDREHDNLKYNLDVTLASASLSCSDTNDGSGHYMETKSLKTTDKSVVFTSLPMYSEGTAIDYSASELVCNHDGTTHSTDGTNRVTNKYSYVRKTDEFTRNGDNIVTGIKLTNELPLTNISATKTWNDQNNRHGLRPSTSEVSFKLYRTSDLTLAYDAASGWELVNAPVTVTDNGNDTWTIIYSNLIEYSPTNALYIYKVVEEYNSATMGAYLENTGTDASRLTSNSSVPTHTEISFTNTLDTKPVTVTKQWRDQGYEMKEHYDLSVSLTPNVSGVQSYRLTVETPAITTGPTNTDVDVSTDVPAYSKNHTEIQYTVTESPQHYHYIPDKTGSGSDIYTVKPVTADSCTITNTLPLANVTIDKIWSDSSNAYALRPDSVSFKLFRKAVAGNEASTWVDLGNYTLDSTNNSTADANKWSREIKGLLKYSEDNNLYIYKAVENYDSSTMGAYLRNTTEPQTPSTDSNERAYNTDYGVSFTNELDTRDITVQKNWEENGYGSTSLRYPVKVTLDCDDANDYSSDQTIQLNNASRTVTFSGLPKFKKNGEPLDYFVTEEVDTSVTGFGTANALTNTDAVNYFTQTNTRYGYEGTCVASKDGSNVVTGFTITNKLPINHFVANKVWDDSSNRDGLRPNRLKFTLTQTKTSTPTASTDTDADAAYTSWTADLGYHPIYDETNTPYGYTVAEGSIVSGGSTVVKNDKITGYLESSTDTDRDTAYGKETTYTFTNEHTPYSGDLKVTKSWQNDNAHSEYTRPDYVTVRLKYRIEGDTEWHYAGDDDYNPSTRNFVKDFVGSGYLFTRIISNEAITGVNDSYFSESWNTTFTGLPLNVNLTGTATSNGTSQKIEYFVEEVGETKLNGYTTSYDKQSVTLTQSYLSDSTTNETVTNTLKTSDVTVVKTWVEKWDTSDSYRPPESVDPQTLHYDTTMKIESSQIGNYNSVHGGNQTITANSGTTLTYQALPLYDKTGTKAVYTLTELTALPGLHEYMYAQSYRTTGGTALSGGSFTPADGQTALVVVNTLTPTQVTVNKEWKDFSDHYKLRPSTIELKLYRTKMASPPECSGTGITNDPTTGWQLVRTESSVSGSGDNWSHTFKNLLQYDEANDEYTFTVVETRPDNLTAYTTTYPTHLTSPGGSKTLAVKNELIVNTVTVRKLWDDTSYAGDQDLLHYDINVKLEADKSAAGVPSTFPTIDSAPESAALYSIAKQNGTDGGSVSIVSVPVYDTMGQKIKYIPYERPTDVNNYGSDSTHYGYEKSYYQTSNPTNGITSFTVDETNGADITVKNTLPLTDVNVHKTWEYDRTYNLYTPGGITVTLSQQSDNVAKRVVRSGGTNNTENVTVALASGENNTTFSNELKYDVKNAPFTYIVEEQLIKGFDTIYTVNGTAINTKQIQANASDITLSIINREIIGSAAFKKIDGTYESLYKDKEGSAYTSENADLMEIALQNATFNLFLTNGDVQCYVKPVEGQSGHYKFLGSNSTAEGATLNVVSGTNGVISISDMPLNTYYLTETAAPTGFITDPRTYTFTVDVNDSNSLKAVVADTSDYKLRNEEIPASVTLTKKDSVTHTAIENDKATYYLLRLIPQGVNTNVNTTGDYLAAAKQQIAAFLPDAPDYTSIKKYWDIIGAYQTDNSGVLTFSGNLDFGTYFLMEIQAPIGYELSNPDSNTFVINESNYSSAHTITHEDDRKLASVQIYKSDEFGNGLNDAEFRLYRKSDNKHIATIYTGDDGLNKTVEIIDTSLASVRQSDMAVILNNWDTYYFKEINPPVGYDESPKDTSYEFIVTRELADETVHIERANDERIKGKVTLLKIAAEEVTGDTDISIGEPISGAEFELYKVGKNSPLSLVQNAEGYIVDDNDVARVTSVTTNAQGRISIEGLDWGQYYLKEITAPGKFALSGNVYFSVGRNNCTEDQQLVCKDEVNKAHIRIDKHINKYMSCWGAPTFIFKLRQLNSDNTYTSYEKTVSVTFEENELSASIPAFDVEPGKYEVSEIQVSRYKLAENDGCKWKIDNDEFTTLPDGKAVFTVDAGQTATVDFTNVIAYYDKFSQTAVKTNGFNGIKALEVSYDTPISTTGGTLLNGYHYQTINKADLAAYLVKSSGDKVAKGEPIAFGENDSEFTVANIAISYTSKENDDARFKVIDNGSSFSVICDPIISSGYIYTLTARYTYAGTTFETTFDITFVQHDTVAKEEVVVTFKADENNRSYFMDNDLRTAYYSFTYVMTNVNGNKTITAIKHNGVIYSADHDVIADVNNALTVNGAMNDSSMPTYYTKTSKWARGGTEQQYTSADVASAVRSAGGNVIYTAVLKTNP